MSDTSIISMYSPGCLTIRKKDRHVWRGWGVRARSIRRRCTRSVTKFYLLASLTFISSFSPPLLTHPISSSSSSRSAPSPLLPTSQAAERRPGGGEGGLARQIREGRWPGGGGGLARRAVPGGGRRRPTQRPVRRQAVEAGAAARIFFLFSLMCDSICVEWFDLCWLDLCWMCDSICVENELCCCEWFWEWNMLLWMI